MLAEHVGKALAGCEWVGIPFAGGMAEVPHIKARGMLINDLHRDVINLARVIADDEGAEWLATKAAEPIFHPDELAEAQTQCKNEQLTSRLRALNYFIAI